LHLRRIPVIKCMECPWIGAAARSERKLAPDAEIILHRNIFLFQP